MFVRENMERSRLVCNLLQRRMCMFRKKHFWIYSHKNLPAFHLLPVFSSSPSDPPLWSHTSGNILVLEIWASVRKKGIHRATDRNQRGAGKRKISYLYPHWKKCHLSHGNEQTPVCFSENTFLKSSHSSL